MSETVASMMQADAKRPPPKDRLDKIRKEIAALRALEFDTASLSERVTENNKKIFEAKTKTIVDLMEAAKVTNLGIEAEGNFPKYEVDLKTVYKANIPEESEKEAFAWLTKNKHGDMIKGTYTVSFGMGEEKERKAFEQFLKKGKYNYSYKFGVPWNTLTAFVKEQIETYKKEPPLKILGATITRMVQVAKPVKEKTAAKAGKK